MGRQHGGLGPRDGVHCEAQQRWVSCTLSRKPRVFCGFKSWDLSHICLSNICWYLQIQLLERRGIRTRNNTRTSIHKHFPQTLYCPKWHPFILSIFVLQEWVNPDLESLLKPHNSPLLETFFWWNKEGMPEM